MIVVVLRFSSNTQIASEAANVTMVASTNHVDAWQINQSIFATI